MHTLVRLQASTVHQTAVSTRSPKVAEQSSPSDVGSLRVPSTSSFIMTRRVLLRLGDGEVRSAVQSL